MDILNYINEFYISDWSRDKSSTSSIREFFIKVAHKLKGVKSDRVNVDALKDTLILYGYVRNYYEINPNYKSVKTDKFILKREEFHKKLEISKMSSPNVSVIRDPFSSDHFIFKIVYSPDFVFNRLFAWFYQTQSSSQNYAPLKYGVLVYPRLDSFIYDKEQFESESLKKSIEPDKPSSLFSAKKEDIIKEDENLIDLNQEYGKQCYPHRVYNTREAFLK